LIIYYSRNSLEVVGEVQLDGTRLGVVEGGLTKEGATGASEGVALGAVSTATSRGLEVSLTETLGLHLLLELSTAAHAVLASTTAGSAVISFITYLALLVLLGQESLVVDGLAGLDAEGLVADIAHDSFKVFL
jgi:hypothetical protein